VSVSPTDTPEAIADEIATEICEQAARCGSPRIECSGGTGGMMTCTGSIEPSAYAECYDETSMDIRDDLVCHGMLTAAEASDVNACINAALAQPCVTEAEIDAYADMLETSTTDPPPLRPIPPECERIETLFDSCSMP
jgi:hypothetical protein